MSTCPYANGTASPPTMYTSSITPAYGRGSTTCSAHCHKSDIIAVSTQSTLHYIDAQHCCSAQQR
eukprot:8396-Heterococcus_DN1.PRE.2